VIGLDGEGLDGPPRYLMLLGSDGSGVIDGDGLTTERCLRYLVGLPRDALLWSFAFSYDVNMILGSWPRAVLADLWESISVPGGTCTVSHGRWTVRWIPGKMFSVIDADSGRRATVWDVWPFVQSSFVEWIARDVIGTDEDISHIAAMKERRGNLDAVPLGDVERYCRAEVRLLAAGVSRMLELFHDADIQPTSYYGAGSLASTLLRRHRVRDHIAGPPRLYRDAVKAAYRGGRFENSFIGWQHAGHLIDLNSAYPAAARNLPCLTHAEWRRVASGDQPTTDTSLCRVEWDIGGDSEPWGPFPVPLPDGSLIYPTTGSGYYWSPEVRSAQRVFGSDRVRIVDAIELRPQCDHRPFDFIDELYSERMRRKAAGDPAEKVIKLALNAVYGKLAQTVGNAPYQSYTWAGLITSHCRAQLLDAMQGAPHNVTMIATDGLTVRTLPAHLDYGAGLGQWSAQPFTHMLAIQPGLYFYADADGETVTRSRGFGKSDITFEYAAGQMPHGVAPRAVDVILARIPTTVRRFIGLGTTVRRRTWATWRTWENQTAAISLNPWPRRARFDCTPDGITTYAPTSIPHMAPDAASQWKGRTLEHRTLEQTANRDGS